MRKANAPDVDRPVCFYHQPPTPTGLGSFANPNALARFERHFNKVNFVTEVAGITYVGVNTVAFAAGPSRAQMVRVRFAVRM